MKAQTSTGWILGMVLAAAAVTSGFAQEGPNSPQTKISPAKAVTATTAQGANAASQSAPQAPATPSKASDESQPPKTPLSTWSRQIQELTQARVDERVILAYITNSAGIFNLTPDHIIHLKNAGVPAQVVTAMIQHDQALIHGAQPMTAAAAPPAFSAPSSPPSGDPPIVASDDSWSQEPWVPDDDFYAPDQPESAGPVRVPYTVKLSDPIIILKLPTFGVPCW